MIEKLRIGVVELLQIGWLYRALNEIAAPLHPFIEGLGWRLQVDHQIGLRQVLNNVVIDGLIETILVVVQGNTGK